MNATELGTQVKVMLDDSAAKLKGLQGKGIQVAGEVAAKAKEHAAFGQVALEKGQQVIEKGQKAVHELLGEIRPQDLLERYGRMTVPELVNKLKSSDLARHTEALRSEILGFLKVPQSEQVARLEVAVEKLNKEVAGLRGLKTDVKKLADQMKVAKAAAKPAK